MAANSESPF